MKNAHSFYQRLRRGLTLPELLVAINIIAIVAALVLPAITSMLMKARMAKQLDNGRRIYGALRDYAADSYGHGEFPENASHVGDKTLVTTSNAAFELLLPLHLNTKSVFFNRQSAYCKGAKELGRNDLPGNLDKILEGECDWAYVRGLKFSSDADWPLIAIAFAPGTITYVNDPAQKGGVWKGLYALIVRVGGAAEIVQTAEKGAVSFVKRTGKPTANAFEKDGSYLAGEDVEVLLPK